MVWEVFPRWKRVHRRPTMEQKVLLFQKMRFAQRAGRFIKNLIITVIIILAIFIIIGFLS